MACCVERQDEVDHRQAGADKQDVTAVGREILHCRARVTGPGIGDEAPPGVGKGAQCPRLLVSNRQRNSFRFDRRSVGESNAPIVV